MHPELVSYIKLNNEFAALFVDLEDNSSLAQKKQQQQQKDRAKKKQQKQSKTKTK